MKIGPAAAAPLLAALLWVASIVVSPGRLTPGSVLLVGLGLIGTATVAVIGMVLTGGRWARWASGAMLATCLVTAALTPIDGLWIVALVATASALVIVLAGGSTRARRQQQAVGPPAAAVALPVLLLLFPAWLGLAAAEDTVVATMIVGLLAPVAALWYTRVLPGGLLGVRLVWPLLALASIPAQGLAPAIVSGAGAVAVAVLAWQPAVKHAFHPPREVGTNYPIPPELTPREVLDAARLDDEGKPRS
ncbi:MAG TPA: hypothetical protein VIC07_00680 [Acidimicrobiia bacterium]